MKFWRSIDAASTSVAMVVILLAMLLPAYCVVHYFPFKPSPDEGPRKENLER